MLSVVMDHYLFWFCAWRHVFT